MIRSAFALLGGLKLCLLVVCALISVHGLAVVILVSASQNAALRSCPPAFIQEMPTNNIFFHYLTYAIPKIHMVVIVPKHLQSLRARLGPEPAASHVHHQRAGHTAVDYLPRER